MSLKTAPIFILAVLLIGCKSGDSSAATSPDTNKPAAADTPAATPTDETSTKSVVGTWTNDGKDLTNSTIEFKDDGTLILHGTVAKMKGVSADAIMTYKLDGDKLTTHTTSMKMTPGPDADAKSKKDAEDANKLFSAPDAFKSEPPEVDTVSWKDKDTFTTTDKSEKVLTFTRKS